MTNMTGDSRFGRIAKFYDTLVDRLGHVAGATDQSEQSRRLRFRALADVTNLDNKRVLDVGCCIADYADYLQERFKNVSYVGIDISARMIDEAKRLRPNLELRLGNILDDTLNEKFDVVTANGIFYLLGKDAAEVIPQVIRRMYDASSCAVAFSTLSSWAPVKEEGEFYADPLETIKICRECTPWVTLRHDYLPHDFVVYMYRERRVV
jgi:SAM-dependent methyltransferase